MKSLHTRLARLAAITCIGLAGSAFAVLAQAPGPVRPGPAATNGPPAPPAFKCLPNEWAGQVQRGINDNFAGGNSEPTAPSADFQAVPGLNLNAPTNVYDQMASNYHFGDTLSFNPPPGFVVTKVRLTTRLKPNSPDATNDGIDFASHPWPTPLPAGGARVAFGIGSMTGGSASWQPPHPAASFVFDFDPSAVKVYVNNNLVIPTPPPNPGYVGSDFFLALNQNKRFDMYAQDDTGADYALLEICAQRSYDLVASKKHDGNVYILNVHNNGQQIMPTGHVDVVEVVPAGLTITTFPPGPWTCTGSLPVVGPDSFTCSYQIPSGGIPANSNLPQIILKSEGKPECENCMRVKLYLKEFEGGVKPVSEGDMKNNVSCTR